MNLDEFNQRALALVHRVFAGLHRPAESLSDPDHCSECREHAQTLATNTLESLGYEHVGNPGWNPTCYMSDEGFRYWFPALVRIASEHEDYWYELLSFYLQPDIGRQGAFTADEQSCIVQLLEWFIEVARSDPEEFAFTGDRLIANAAAWKANLRERPQP